MKQRLRWMLPMIWMMIVTSPGRARKWTDSTGGHSLEAEIVEVKDGNVRLKKGDGKSIDIALAKLSEADRNYAISWQTRQVQRRAIAMVRRLKGHWAFDEKRQERPLVLIDILPTARTDLVATPLTVSYPNEGIRGNPCSNPVVSSRLCPGSSVPPTATWPT